MKLKKHGAFLVNFVIDFVNGDMSRFFLIWITPDM